GFGCYVFRRPDGIVERRSLNRAPVRLPDGRLDDHYQGAVSFAVDDDWVELRRVALEAKHITLTIADLIGRPLGAAFVEHVLRGPKARACLDWLSSEFPQFESLACDGAFPIHPAQSLIFGGVKWPVMLDRDGLYQEIVCAAVGVYRQSDIMTCARDWNNPLFQTAEVIADRHKAFFDLLRGEGLIAKGNSEEMVERVVPSDQ